MTFSRMLDLLSPSSQAGLGEYAIFRIINDYLTRQIDDIGFAMMERTMSWAASIAGTLVVLWIMIMGYRMVTGQSNGTLRNLLVGSLRNVLIITAATTMSFGGTNLYQLFTQDMDRAVHGLFSGHENQSTADAIDKNLGYLQVALTAIDGVQVSKDDPTLQDQKTRALVFAGFGLAGPAMVAGVLYLTFKCTMAFSMALGPIFILCLMFDQTKGHFVKWLNYTIGTIFSMGCLSVMSGVILELVARIAAGLWVAKLASIVGVEVEGISSQALQQGGVGLLATALLITVPQSLANFFQGQLGSFMHFSAFSGGAGGGGGSPGPQGQPPGSYSPLARNDSQQSDKSYAPTKAASATYNHSNRTTGTPPVHEQRIKSADEVTRD